MRNGADVFAGWRRWVTVCIRWRSSGAAGLWEERRGATGGQS